MNVGELIELASGASERVYDALIADTDDVVEKYVEITDAAASAAATLAIVADHLRMIAESQPVLTDGELALHTLIAAASMARAGDITLDEFHEITARESFRAEGIEPTEEQLATRVSEFRTANSFISAVARGE